MNNLPEDPHKKNLVGHEDLESFAKHLGINYSRLREINQKNAEVVKQHKSSESKFFS